MLRPTHLYHLYFISESMKFASSKKKQDALYGDGVKMYCDAPSSSIFVSLAPLHSNDT